MESSEKILVINKEYSNKIKISGSVFIGYAYPINSVEHAQEILEKIKKEHFSATHHCYAIKMGENEIKYSDDGEPSGTAGIRILNSINSFSLTNIIVIVVRYFGGTKLGVGPLGKAYSDTSSGLLETAEIIELINFSRIKITYNYNDTSSVHYLLNKFNCREIENEFESEPSIKAAVEPRHFNNLKEELTEKTAGRAYLALVRSNIYLNLK